MLVVVPLALLAIVWVVRANLAPLRRLRERLAAASDRLKRTRITAPEAGMVMGMAVHTVGGVVGQGTPLLDIVPADQPLVVEVQISPLDIDRVQIGKPAKVRFSAFKSALTSKLNDGDIIVVDRSLQARHGDVVVAQVDNDFTVKYLHKRGGRFKLVPANPTFPDIVPRDGQTVIVVGVVTSVVKQFRKLA